ncbi:MAG: LytTR family DNA-binding domain-containing protein [Chitinophagaceae bacterium]
MLNCIIVDDEPLAREGLANYVKEVDFLQLNAVCENPLQLIKLLKETSIDLIFLDIHMPKMSGIDFLKITPQPPMVIITTAFPDYALDGFKFNVVDYLLKPITFESFFKAASKAWEYHQLVNAQTLPAQQASNTAVDYFFIKCANKYEKIFFTDILYIEALQNYVSIYTTKGKYMTLLLLKTLEENLADKAFIRVHKSYIVSIDKIESIEGNELKIQSHNIPISRNYRDQVMEQVVKKKLWIK